MNWKMKSMMIWKKYLESLVFRAMGVLVFAIILVLLIVKAQGQDSRKYLENTVFVRQPMSVETGVVYGTPEPLNLEAKTQIYVAKVILDGSGMVPVLIANPNQVQNKSVIPGQKVKIRCIFYGYAQNTLREACTILY
jgi:hypothetical protein